LQSGRDSFEHYNYPLHDEGLRALLHHYRKRLFKCVQPACFDRDKVNPSNPRARPSTSAGFDDRNVRIEQNAKTREVPAVFPSATQTACPNLAARIYGEPG